MEGRKRVTYSCNLDAGRQMGFSLDLGVVQTAQDLAIVGGQGHQNLWAFAAHSHQANRRLWVCLGLCGVEQRDSVGLGIKAGGSVPQV